MPTRTRRGALLGAVAALALAGAVNVASASAATITTVPDNDAGALSLAQSMFQNPALITGAHWVAHPGNLSATDGPDAVVTGSLSFFPQDGQTFGLMTSGDAQLADDPNNSPSSGTDDGGPAVNGDTSYDVSILKVDFVAPANTNCLSVGTFAFYSEEYPEYVGSAYNDAFIAEMDHNTWTTSGSNISAPDNFAFDPNHDVVSINSTGATSMSAANAAGTTYDGATGLLQASTQVTPGTHSLYLSIFDQGDHIYDSAVMVDNIIVGTVPNPNSQCQPGAQEHNYNMTLTPASATNTVGQQHTVTATVTDASSNQPVDGGKVHFQVSGANSASGTETTDSQGKADFTYTGTNAGDDTIIACFDSDNDGNYCEPGEPTASATKHWNPAGGGTGKMVSNATRSGAKFASIVDCDAATANANHRPFDVAWSGKTFKLTSVSSVSCFDDPAFTPSPTPATTAFDTQTGSGPGTLNGNPGYTLQWRLEDHGAPSADDAASLKITRNSDGAVVLNVPLGKVSSGQIYAMPS